MSHIVQLDKTNDFSEWRKAARSLCEAGIPPDEVSWTTPEKGRDLFGAAPATDGKRRAGQIRASSAFLEIAKRVICFRDSEKFARLYRLLWHMQTEPRVLANGSDPDVAWVTKADKAIRRDVHKMHAFVRFRKAGEDPTGREQFAAWFEPTHLITEIATPFFKRRFPNMDWMIVTPDCTATWDGKTLRFTLGGQISDVPASDGIEAQWKQYFVSIFNPARLKVDAMMAEMPKKYWKNMPEAALIPEMIERAEHRTHLMQEQQLSQSKNQLAELLALRRERSQLNADSRERPTSLHTLSQHLSQCERCPLHSSASQAVPGEGPEHARMMIVGEQPGDQEDIQGRPFVGPAGQLLDAALAKAGIHRADAFVTNAVKHFKFTTRGKRRLHAKPNLSEIDHCRWWLDLERSLVKPDVVIALGASAARGVLGRSVKIGEVRSKAIPLENGGQLIVTVHPSYLLRLQDEGEKSRQMKLFIDDLVLAQRQLSQPSDTNMTIAETG